MYSVHAFQTGSFGCPMAAFIWFLILPQDVKPSICKKKSSSLIFEKVLIVVRKALSVAFEKEDHDS